MPEYDFDLDSDDPALPAYKEQARAEALEELKKAPEWILIVKTDDGFPSYHLLGRETLCTWFDVITKEWHVINSEHNKYHIMNGDLNGER